MGRSAYQFAHVISMRVMNIDLSSCRLTAPGTVSKKAGHPHPDALLDQPVSLYTGRWSLQLLVGLVQWSITSSTGYIISSQPNGDSIELTVNTLIFRILLVKRVRSRSFSPFLPQNPELPNQLSIYQIEHHSAHLLRRKLRLPFTITLLSAHSVLILLLWRTRR